MNPQSYTKDIAEVKPGGYVLYDSSWKRNFNRDDITVIELPITSLCIAEFTNPKQRQLFKNLVYVGALAFMLDIPKSIYVKLIKEQFKGKEKLIDPNVKALNIGYNYARKHFKDICSCLLYTSPSPRDQRGSRMPSSA